MDINTLWLIFNNPGFAIAVELLGGWIILKYFVPRSTAQGGIEIARRLVHDPEVAPLIATLKEYSVKAKPFIDAMAKIKPEDVDALVKALKEFTSTEEKVKLKLPKKENE